LLAINNISNLVRGNEDVVEDGLVAAGFRDLAALPLHYGADGGHIKAGNKLPKPGFNVYNPKGVYALNGFRKISRRICRSPNVHRCPYQYAVGLPKTVLINEDELTLSLRVEESALVFAGNKL
jgi:hypothetical protein